MFADDEPITTVAELLAANGRTFIHAAYWGLLGRGPDVQGEAYYLTRLRSGAHKLNILKQMRRSPEGRASKPVISGVDEAIERHLLVNLPVIGIFLALFVKGDRDTPAKAAMRRLEQNVIAEMIRVNSELASGELKGALDWIDTRIGRLLEVSFALEDRTKDMEQALKRITAQAPELQAARDYIRSEDGLSALTGSGPGLQRACLPSVRDFHDRTACTTVADVLQRIELELQAARGHIRSEHDVSAQDGSGPGLQRAGLPNVRDLHDRTASMTVAEVLQRIELELI